MHQFIDSSLYIINDDGLCIAPVILNLLFIFKATLWTYPFRVYPPPPPSLPHGHM